MLLVIFIIFVIFLHVVLLQNHQNLAVTCMHCPKSAKLVHLFIYCKPKNREDITSVLANSSNINKLCEKMTTAKVKCIKSASNMPIVFLSTFHAFGTWARIC